jgi:hypothetical protein
VADAPRGSLGGVPDLLTCPAAELSARLDRGESLLPRSTIR